LYNETRDCAIGTTVLTTDDCDVLHDGKIRRCLPSSEAKDEENFDINPDDDEPRYGFTKTGSCGNTAMCMTGHADNDGKCASKPSTSAILFSAHGVCTPMGEMALADGEKCWGSNYQCVNNNCLFDNKAYTCQAQAPVTEYDSAEFAFKVANDAADPSTSCTSAPKRGDRSMSTARIANGDYCTGNACVSGSMCVMGICRKHVQNLESDDRDAIMAIHDSENMNKCDDFKTYSEASPYLGLAFNLLIMSFVIGKHTFATASWGQRHGGFMIAACIATMVSIYLVHLTYYEKTYDIANKLITYDCSGTDDLDAAYFMNLHLQASGGACQRYSTAFTMEELDKYLGVTAYINPVAEEFAYMFAGFTGAISLSILSLGLVVLMQLGNGCIEQVVYEFDAVSSSATGDSAKESEMGAVPVAK